MKKTTQLLIAIIFAGTLCILNTSGNVAFGQKPSSAIRIGTYDSRIVVFAWSRSDYFKQKMTQLNQRNDSAQKSHDSARIKEVSIEMMSYQHLLHQMVFSNGSMNPVLALVKNKLPDLAKTQGVSVILSKWELGFCDPSVEIVDLTTQVSQLFLPKENIDQMSKEISAQKPVPLDEMGIEAEMLDGYCKLFGKK